LLEAERCGSSLRMTGRLARIKPPAVLAAANAGQTQVGTVSGLLLD